MYYSNYISLFLAFICVRGVFGGGEDENGCLHVQRPVTVVAVGAPSSSSSAEEVDTLVAHRCGLDSGFTSAGGAGNDEDDLSLEKWEALGNALSRVWEARAHSILMGHKDFTFHIHGLSKATPEGHSHPMVWLSESYKPIVVCAGDVPPLRAACATLMNSTKKCMVTNYVHELPCLWTMLRPVIQRETQMALVESSLSQSLPPTTVVIHLRLHFQYQALKWPTEMMLRDRIPLNASRVMIMHQPYNVGNDSQDPIESKKNSIWQNVTEQIDKLLEMYASIARDACRGCPVHLVSNGVQQDFSTLVEAPILICTGSTFCLWAAMANTHTAHVCTTAAGGTQPELNSKTSDGDFYWMEGGIQNFGDNWMFKNGFRNSVHRAQHDLAFLKILLSEVPASGSAAANTNSVGAYTTSITTAVLAPSTVSNDVTRETKKGKIVLVLLSTSSDIPDMLNLERTLERVSGYHAIVVLHNGDLASNMGFRGVFKNAQFVELDDATWSRFPPGFNVSMVQNHFTKRKPFSYNHMIRFWMMDVFDHPALDDAEYYVRLDSDSCFTDEVNLTDLIRPTTVYVPNFRIVDDKNFRQGLLPAVEKYLNTHNIVPQIPSLWQEVLKYKGGRGFYNNFELVKLSFFRQPEGIFINTSC